MEKIDRKGYAKRNYDQQLTQNTSMQSRLRQKLRTLIFCVWLFLDRTENKNESMGMDLWMLTEETLESDTKMIRGVPIFSASAM
jgi:hypothetical protein